MEENYKALPAQMHHLAIWISLVEPTAINHVCTAALKKVGFTIVGFTDHHFPKEGYTCVWLLAESHLAVHSFPAAGKSYVQLSSCNLEKKQQLQQLLQAMEVTH